MVKFGLGRLLATPGALEVVEKSGDNLSELLTRHAAGDWGDVCPADRRANEDALRHGARLFSSYRLRDRTQALLHRQG
jgi:hypothetical protein